MGETQNIRNIVLVGHSGAGKTTVAEGLLHAAGLSGTWAEPKDGHFDYTDEERERSSSLYTGIYQGQIGDVHLTLLDTPGAPDFVGEAVGAISAADTAVFVISANDVVGVSTRKMHQIAQDIEIPMAIVLTKPDVENVSVGRALEEIQTFFGPGAVLVTKPEGEGTGYSGISDVREGADELEHLAEAICSVDEELMDQYLEAGELTPDQMKSKWTEAMLSRDLIPIFTVCGARKEGAAELLQVIVDSFPSPAEVMTVKAQKDGEPVEIQSDGPLVARVFNSHLDPFVGRINYVRVYGGTAKRDMLFLCQSSSRPEKLGIPQLVVGPKLGDNIDAGPGMIFGMAKCDSAKVTEQIVSPELEGLKLVVVKAPKPMVMVALEPATRKDADKLVSALRRRMEVDACIDAHRDEGTGELVLAGCTDLHLRIVLDGIKRNDKVEAITKPPRVPYKETVTGKSMVRYRHKKQSGGSGEFAEVELTIEPADADFIATGEDTLQYKDALKGMNVDRIYIPSVEKGVRGIMSRGILAGFQVINIKVTFTDGKQHDVDSKDRAFQTAAREAFKQGFLGVEPRDWNLPNRVEGNAKPVLLEPVVILEVTTPSSHQGTILGDMSKRRGQVQGQESKGDMVTITVKVPQAEVTSYSSELQSMTAGEGYFTMDFSHYERVPGNVQADVVARTQRAKEAASAK